MKIESGENVVVVLHTPREKLLGIVDEIAPSGIFIKAIELGYFEDWCSSISRGEQYLPMSDQFVPMWRVERISRDESSAGSDSMSAQFEKRTGHKFGDI